jgi:hypothetical protein
MSERASRLLTWQWILSMMGMLIASFFKNGYMFALNLVVFIDFWLTSYRHKGYK